MPLYLGLDTSNYTTSAAVYDSETNTVINKSIILKVKQGERGLRQSDAVFLHIQNFAEVFSNLFSNIDSPISVCAASKSPRDTAESYMPCFTVGEAFAKAYASSIKIPYYGFSHQAGHIAAALYSSSAIDTISGKFIALHVSGGTTEILLCNFDGVNIEIRNIGATLDLNAGQVIDRIGVTMGLTFPAGRELEKLAKNGLLPSKPKICVNGANCNLSGLENICVTMLNKGTSKEDVSLFALESIKLTLEQMIENAFKLYGTLPVLFAGGVMSNTIIKQYFTAKYKGWFADPDFSRDNAAGIAILAWLKTEGNKLK